MELFTIIEDAVAIVRLPKGILKQTKVYHRGKRIFVPHGAGFIRVTARFGSDPYGTSHPDIKVLELEGDGINTGTSEPRYEAAVADLRAVA